MVSLREIMGRIPSEVLPFLDDEARRLLEGMPDEATESSEDLRRFLEGIPRQVRPYCMPRALPPRLERVVPDGTTLETFDERRLQVPRGALVKPEEAPDRTRLIYCLVPPRGPAERSRREGPFLAFYPGGKLRAQGYYSANERDGPWITYRDNGRRERVEHYRRGKLHGIRLCYYASGIVESEGDYVNDRLHGWQKLWNPDGCPLGATFHHEGRPIEKIFPDGTRRRA
jgi:hypothetical protein